MSRLSQIFAPKEREFFDLFEEAGANAVRAAGLLESMLEQWPEQGEALRDVVVCEQEGDRITHDIINRLILRYLAVERGMSPLTVASYARELATLADFCRRRGLVDWQALDERLVRTYAAERHQRGLSGRSIQRALSATRCPCA